MALTARPSSALAQPETHGATRVEKAVLLTFVIVPLVATVVGIWMIWDTVWNGHRLVSWADMGVLALMYVLTGVGITVGYHRMLTHRSFDAPPFVRFFLLACGSMAVEGGALTWARIHLIHHANSDKEGDPHSPLDGFWHAHFGWMYDGFRPIAGRYDTWLTKDPMIVWFERTFAFWVLAGLVIPFLLAGWTGLFWGGLVRICLGHHITWSVNSVCHTFGKRMFETPDQSRNQWVVGLLALGEGWHNNHHAFPRSAFHGMRWYQFDFAALVIRSLEKVGLATNVWRVPPERFEAELRKADAARRGAGARKPVSAELPVDNPGAALAAANGSISQPSAKPITPPPPGVTETVGG